MAIAWKVIRFSQGISLYSQKILREGIERNSALLRYLLLKGTKIVIIFVAKRDDSAPISKLQTPSFQVDLLQTPSPPLQQETHPRLTQDQSLQNTYWEPRHQTTYCLVPQFYKIPLQNLEMLDWAAIFSPWIDEKLRSKERNNGEGIRSARYNWWRIGRGIRWILWRKYWRTRKSKSGSDFERGRLR